MILRHVTKFTWPELGPSFPELFSSVAVSGGAGLWCRQQLSNCTSVKVGPGTGRYKPQGSDYRLVSWGWPVM